MQSWGSWLHLLCSTVTVPLWALIRNHQLTLCRKFHLVSVPLLDFLIIHHLDRIVNIFYTLPGQKYRLCVLLYIHLENKWTETVCNFSCWATLGANATTWLVCTNLTPQSVLSSTHRYPDSYVYMISCSYIDFSHQDVSDAPQYSHKVKHVPGVL